MNRCLLIPFVLLLLFACSKEDELVCLPDEAAPALIACMKDFEAGKRE